MKRILLSLLLLAAGAAWVGAQNDSKAGKSGSAQDRYEALEKEFESAQAEFRAAYSKATTDEERAKLRYPQPGTYAERFLKLAQEFPNESAALDALVWVATNCRGSKEQETSLDLLQKNHVRSPKLARVAQALVYSYDKAAEAWLRAVLKETPVHEVKGWATFSLGRVMLSHGGSSNARSSEAEKLFEEVAANYKDVKSYERTLADLGTSQLFELRNLAIGQAAPDIEGKDVGGNAFKLSDYRGKVVVIDFWGDW